MQQAEYASWMINPAELEAEKEQIREAEEILFITSLEVQGLASGHAYNRRSEGFKPGATGQSPWTESITINNNQED